jgi:hypothetical protein
VRCNDYKWPFRGFAWHFAAIRNRPAEVISQPCSIVQFIAPAEVKNF